MYSMPKGAGLAEVFTNRNIITKYLFFIKQLFLALLNNLFLNEHEV